MAAQESVTQWAHQSSEQSLGQRKDNLVNWISWRVRVVVSDLHNLESLAIEVDTSVVIDLTAERARRNL